MGGTSSKDQDEISTQLANDPELDASTFPKPDGLTLQLDSPPRTVGYAIFGASEAPTERTILFMHGTPGTRFFFSRTHEAYLHARNARVILVERPGFGLSTPNSSRTLLSTMDDACAVLQHEGHARVHVLGYSAGGAYALAFARRFPSKCRSVAVVSSLSPNVAGVTTGMTLLSKFGYMLAGRFPTLLRALVRVLSREMVAQPFRSSMDDFTERENEVFRSDLEIRRVFAMCILELYGRDCGAHAEADDYVLFARDWGFELGEIDEEVAVVVYGGGLDNKCTSGMFEAIVSGLPKKKLKSVWVQDETHLYFYKLFTDRLFTDIGLDS